MKKRENLRYIILLIAYASHFVYYYSVFNHTYSNVEHLVWLAILAFTIGFAFGDKYKIKITKKKIGFWWTRKISYKKLLKVALCFICIGIVSHLLFYGTNGIGNYAEGYGSTRGSGYITAFFNLWIVGMIIIEYLTQNGFVNVKVKWFNRILMVLYVVLYLFVLSKRRQIIVLFLACMGIWKDTFSKKTKFIIYCLGIIAIVFFSVFGQVRGYVDTHGLAQGFSYAINNFSIEWLSLKNFEGKYISRTLNDVYSYVREYGHVPSIILGVLCCMIPRKLLGGTKPLSFPEWYTKTFYFDDYIRGTGYAGSIVGELYLVGGIACVILGYFLFGYISARIQKYRLHKESIRDTLIYSLFLYTIFILPRYDFSSLLIDIVFLYLPIIAFCGDTNSKVGIKKRLD